jgi:hypothetical protein
MIHHYHTTGTAQTTLETVLPFDPLPCPQCGPLDRPAVGPGCGPHIASARCRHCGRFLQWLSQYLPAERQARRQRYRLEAMVQRPPNQLQLAYVQALGDVGPPPVNMAETSQRIEALRKGLA